MTMSNHNIWLPVAGLVTLVMLAPACGGDDAPPDDADPYAFAEDAPADYTRVDRIGMPAIGTAVIMDKQAYNEADPAADASGAFVDQITMSVEGLHAALDDDLMTAGLVACAPADCVSQAAPLVVPDTLKIDFATGAGFPNGRKLTDPVIDVTLAVVLLDLTATGQDATSLVGVLNPTANDLPFETSFPYLAPYQGG
ncbi:DUF4331 family protein [Enhygromyxa salina]|uniref:Lipoprotein n=1 Tax=Enhygromyxa salina TaxID=215803 RepID=A0A2S9YN00_9BACT|nr:DUF4331 family protein [Enhygromyxa salina]PRQ06460.1 hypothetical protein ENSA7_37790 [Enhygromyxa salina]